jgi:hypothetical protein
MGGEWSVSRPSRALASGKGPPVDCRLMTWKSVLFYPNTAAIGLLYFSTLIYSCVKRLVPLIRSNNLFTRWTPGTHCTRGAVGPRASLDTEVREKILCLCQGSNLNHIVIQPIARHYTDRATQLTNICKT